MHLCECSCLSCFRFAVHRDVLQLVLCVFSSVGVPIVTMTWARLFFEVPLCHTGMILSPCPWRGVFD